MLEERVIITGLREKTVVVVLMVVSVVSEGLLRGKMFENLTALVRFLSGFITN